MKKKGLTKEQVQLKYGYRSGLEERVAQQILEAFGEVEYEQMKIPFIQPEKKRTYKPDFVLPNGIIIETKGRFLLDDRQKHIWIKAQYPELDIRFVFSNSNALLRKGAKTSYADWCERYNFKYADKQIPKGWLKNDYCF